MSSNRIRTQINLKKSDSVILVYGQVNDTFITNDLRIYNIDGIEKILCRFLKENGYDQVIFYAPERQLYAYDEQSYQCSFPEDDSYNINLSKNANSGNTDGRPLGKRKLLNTSATESGQGPSAERKSITVNWHKEGFIPIVSGKSKSDVAIVDIIREALFQSKYKSAVVFSQFDDPSLTSEIQRLIIPLIPRLQRRTNENKCFIITNAVDQDKLKEVVDSVPALNKIVKMEDAGKGLDSLVYVGYPHQDEIRNLLNYLRLKKSVNVDWSNFNRLVIGLDRLRDQLKRWETDFKGIELIDIHSVNQFLDHPISTDSRSALNKLQKLVGLEKVKSTLRRHILQIQDMREYSPSESPLMHICLKGNPGTGKTTLARLIADIFRESNLLERGHLIEVDRERLVAGYIGQTAVKTDSCCREALGGVLFVDEAYALAPKGGNFGDENNSQDFGQEAIDTLIKRMTDWQDRFCVILAGYPNEIDHLLSKNPGFTGRIGLTIEIEDYLPEELTQIFCLKAERGSKIITDHFKEYLFNIFTELYLRRGKKFDNARTVEQLYIKVSGLHLERCFRENLNRREEPFQFADLPPELSKKASKEIHSETALERLGGLVGLDKAKEQIRKQLAMVEAGKKNSSYAGGRRLHLVLKGNPGTGKTTVARLVGEIYQDYQILSSNTFIEASRQDLVGGYQGQTATKVDVLCTQAMGGVLFIDEAYTLIQGDGDQFGKEAVNSLLKVMEDEKDNFCVIIAGYPKNIEDFLDSNPGLRRRFATEIDFDDYTPRELSDIFNQIIQKKGIVTNSSFKEKVSLIIESLYGRRDENFGNAGIIENLIQKILENHAVRCLDQKLSPVNTALAVEDIPEEYIHLLPVDNSDEIIELAMKELNALIGLQEVKSFVRRLIKEYKHNQLRYQRHQHIKKEKRSYHMVFKGNSGTGKTTVARIMGKIFKALDILKKGEVVEVSRADFVAGYLGQTANKTNKLIRRSFDNILFIDEAYSLVKGRGDSFGNEAIDTLLKMMEDHRDRIVVIAAGYRREMRLFLESNSGLSSRFPNHIEFKDYDEDQMLNILKFTIKNEGYKLAGGLDTNLKKLLLLQKNEKRPNYGNARDIKNYFFNEILPRYLDRVNNISTENKDYWVITSKDIRDADEIMGERGEDNSAEAFSPKREVNTRNKQATRRASLSTISGDIVYGNKVIYNNNYGSRTNELPFELTPISTIEDLEINIRNEDAISIYEKLFDDLKSDILLVHGLPGIGKSRAVLKFIQKYKSAFDHAIWINASEGVERGLVNSKLEGILGIEFQSNADLFYRLNELVKGILKLERKILFVFENIEKDHTTEIKGLVSKFTDHKVILISREKLEFPNSINIDFPNSEEAKKLFREMSEREMSEEKLTKLLDLVSCHPYALKLISSVFNAHKNLTVDEILGKVANGMRLRQVKSREQLETAKSSEEVIDVFKSLFRLWELSEIELDFLMHFAILPSSPFTYEFLTTFLVADQGDIENLNFALKELEKKNLISTDLNNSYYCPKIIQQTCRESEFFSSFEPRRLLVSLGVELGNKISIGIKNKGIYDLVGYYLPILEHFISHYSDSNLLSLHRIFINLSILYRFIGQFEKSIEIAQRERKVLKDRKYEYPSWYSTLLRNIGFTNQLKGEYAKAEEYYQEAEEFLLSIDQDKTDNGRKINMESELTLLYTHLGQIQLRAEKYDLEKSIFYFTKGIELAENESLQAPGTLATLKEGLAIVYLEFGQYREAIEELRDAKSIYKNQLKIHETSLVIGQLDSLMAIAYSGNGNYANSLNLAKNAKTILLQHFGDDSIEVVKAYSGEAITIINQLIDVKENGEYNIEDYTELIRDAEQSMNKAIELTKKFKGEKHSDLAIMYSNYSLILSMSDKRKKGYTYAKEALDIMKNNNIENAILMGLYLRIYIFFEGQFSYELAEEGMRVGLRIIPKGHDQLLDRGYIHYLLGVIMHDSGAKSREGIIEIDNALKCVRDYYDIDPGNKNSSSERSPLEVVCLEQIASIHYELDETSSALTVQKEVIEICEANMDVKSEEFAERCLRMCQIHLKAAQQYGQMSHYADALECKEKMRIANPDLLESNENLQDFARLYLIPAPSDKKKRKCIVIPEANRESFCKKIKNEEEINLLDYGHCLKQLHNEPTDKMINRFTEKYGSIEMELVVK